MSLKLLNGALFLFSVFLSAQRSYAQICTGSLGDPVVNITFGSGNNPGPALSAQLPNLGYFSQDCPGDGFYTIVNSTNACFGNTWHTASEDHTPGDVNGYMMLINASLNSGDFYINTVNGLCAGTTYEFAAWILNVLKQSSCNAAGISPNLTFNIESTSGQVLGTYNTGAIPQSNIPEWKQYGLFFKMPANESSVVLRITNNAPGGCGNDLAIDDITFRPCGPLVTASISGNTPAAFCEGDLKSVQLSATLSAGYTAPSYQWQLSIDNGLSWSDINGATSNTYLRTPTGTGTFQYRLSVSEAGNIGITNCRVASNAIIIKVNPRPVLAVSNNGPKCTGGVITLSATGASTYSWTGPNGFTASGATVTASNLTAAAKYYVTGTSAEGCSSQDSTTAITYANPVLAFASSTPACINSPITFTNQSTIATGQTITKYSWAFGDGNISTLQNPVHSFTAAGQYDVVLSAETNNGCTASLTRKIPVNPLPEVNFGMPEVCLSDPFALFTDSTAISDNSQAQFVYLWNFGDASATAANPNTSALKNPKHTYISTGVYQVTLSVTSKDGCVADTTKAFTVNGATPVANFVIDQSAALCSNKDVTITNNSSVNFGVITKLEIYWDQNDPTSKTTDEDPKAGKKYNNTYPEFGSPATKTYVIKLVAYSGISCVNQTTQSIVLNATPQIQFNALQPVCAAVEPFIINSAGITNTLPGTGVYNGTGIITSGLFNPEGAGAGEHTIRYTYTGTNTCSNFAEQTITVYPQPIVNAGPDRTVLEGGFITLQATASGNGLSYLWTPATGLDNTALLTPKASPPADQLYLLTVTSSNNCVASDDVFVKLLKTPIVPTAFSPNGDGINDSWIIRYLDSYQDVDVQVFDRFGQLVFKSRGYSSPWNGTRNGKPLPIGVYYYIINTNNSRPVIKGSVTIVR